MKRAGFLRGVGAATTLAQFVPTPLNTITPYTPTTRIAVVAPASGDAAGVGKQLIVGVQAGVAMVNDLRLPSEPAMLVTVLDDQNDPAQAPVQASFAAGDPTIVVVIGHLSAAPTLAALQTYYNANLPLIVPTVTADRVTAQGYRTVFRLPTKDSDEGGMIAAYAITSGAKAPLVVSFDSGYGPDVADGFVRRASSMRVNANEVKIPLRKPDLDTAATRVMSLAPDTVALAGTAETLGSLLGALRAKGFTGRFFASQGFFEATIVKTYAKDAEGLIVASDMPYLPLAPTAQRDVQDYQLHYGTLTPVAAFGYAAVQLVRLAAKRTGATTRATFARALATGGSYDAITGTYMFGATGDVINPNTYFYVVKGGTFAYDRQAHPSGFMLK